MKERIVVVALLMAGLGCNAERPLPPGLQDRLENHEFRIIASPATQFPAGTEVDLRMFRGKPLVIDFWASWCGPCRRTHELMVDLATRYEDRGAAFLGVLYEDSPSNAEKWLNERGTNYPAVEDIEGELAETFWVNAIPRIVVLGPDGRLIEDVLNTNDVVGILSSRLDSLLAVSRLAVLPGG